MCLCTAVASSPYHGVESLRTQGAAMDLRKIAKAEGITDVGTLWIMQRRGHHARCALFVRGTGWELHLIIDGVLTLSERSARGADTFALADRWKRRMLERGWLQVVPGVAAARAS